MTIDLLVQLAIKTFVLSGVTLIFLHLLRRRSAEERSWIAHVGLTATLLVPIAAWFGPHWAIEAPALVGPSVSASVVDGSQHALPSTIAAGSAGLWQPDTVLALYLLPAVVLMLIVTIGVARLLRLRTHARVLTDHRWISALANAQERMDYKHGTALLVSGTISSPVSWGIFRPVIVLSEWSAASADHAEAIIAHELAHVARFDWLKLVLCRVATAVLWFNPLVWVLAKQCHQLQEEAADDAVLRHDVPEHDYVELLIRTAKQERRQWRIAANGVAPGGKSLSIRVARVLDTEMCRRPVTRAWAAPALMGAAAFSTCLAAITPVRSASTTRQEVIDQGTVEASGPSGAGAERVEAVMKPRTLPTPSRPTVGGSGLASTCGDQCGRPASSAQSVPPEAIKVVDDDDDDANEDRDFARALMLARALSGADLQALGISPEDAAVIKRLGTSEGKGVRSADCANPPATAPPGGRTESRTVGSRPAC